MTRKDFQQLPAPPHFPRNPLLALLWLARGAGGLIFGTALLAVMAATPGLNLLAMGYLLEIQGRVARTGKFRAAFYLLPAAARIGGVLVLSALFLLPVRWLAGMARDTWLLAPGGGAAWAWIAALVLAGIVVSGHLLLAIGRGGAWWWFVRPLSNLKWTVTRLRAGFYWRDADQALREFLAALRPARHLWLGVIGYAGVYLWVSLPTWLFSLGPDLDGKLRVICLLVASAALIVILGWAPFLLTNFAATRRWRSILDLRAVRARFRRSPFCWTLAAVLLFGLSVLPMLYEALVKNPLPPHPARWDIMAVFLVTVLPGKVLVAWAWARSANRPEPWRIWQWFNRLLLAVALGYYVYFLFLAWTGGELGRSALWRHHALLQPFPF